MARVPGYDWEAIRNTYVLGEIQENGTVFYPEVADLIPMYKCGNSTVFKHCREEGWVALRAQHQAELGARTRELSLEAVATAASTFNPRCLALAEEALFHLEEKFKEARREFRRTGDTATMTKLKDWVATLERTQRVGRLALGESTENGAIHVSWTDVLEGIDDTIMIEGEVVG